MRVRNAVLALDKARTIGFARYIISATTPFTRADMQDVRTNAPAVVARRVPRYEEVYLARGWSMFPTIDRVYVNERARRELGWHPQYDFSRVLELAETNGVIGSPLAQVIGSKGYHATAFADGPKPVE